MIKNKGGSIIITSSIGGEKGFAYESLYCMTKGAVLQLARSIAVEYRDDGIRCNAICPGFVKTDHGLREIDQLDNLGQDWNEKDLKSVQGRICENLDEWDKTIQEIKEDPSVLVNWSNKAIKSMQPFHTSQIVKKYSRIFNELKHLS